jgi:hypothetical protein
MDYYATPVEAVLPVLPHLRAEKINRFVEPCAGDHDLVEHLERQGFSCAYASDLRYGDDARDMRRDWFDGLAAQAIITNPPWSRQFLYPLLDTFLRMGVPVWLLLYGDIIHTRHFAPYIPRCTDIVSVGRVRWIVGSLHTSKDNAVWIRLQAKCRKGPVFHGRQLERAQPDEEAAA